MLYILVRERERKREKEKGEVNVLARTGDEHVLGLNITDPLP